MTPCFASADAVTFRAWPTTRSRHRSGWRSCSRPSPSASTSGSVSRWSTCCGNASSRCAWPRRPQLDDQERAAVYYTALLINVGCHSDAHEQAKWFGDDIDLKRDKYVYDFRSLAGAVASMRRIGAGNTPLHRLRTGLEFVVSGRTEVDGMIEQHAALARQLAEELGLPRSTFEALGSSYERWDGRGWPGDQSGAAIPIASRISQLAEFVEVAHRTSGTAEAIAVAQRGSGKHFDPGLVTLLTLHAPTVFGEVDRVDTWQAVIEGEPALTVRLSTTEFESALEAIANFVDLKSPFTLGHSGAVADLAAAAGQAGRAR